MTAAKPRVRIMPAPAATALGLLLAPIVGGAVAMPIYLLVMDLMNGRLESSGTLNDLLGAIQVGAYFGGYMGVIPAFLFGVPVHAALMNTGRTHLPFYVGLGPVIAFVSFAIVSPLYGFGAAWSSPARDYLPVVLLCGAFGGIVFWLIRRPRRKPDTITQNIREPAA